jgi:hypothetical protein
MYIFLILKTEFYILGILSFWANIHLLLSASSQDLKSALAPVTMPQVNCDW